MSGKMIFSLVKAKGLAQSEKYQSEVLIFHHLQKKWSFFSLIIIFFSLIMFGNERKPLGQLKSPPKPALNHMQRWRMIKHQLSVDTKHGFLFEHIFLRVFSLYITGACTCFFFKREKEKEEMKEKSWEFWDQIRPIVNKKT